ncbi:MAG: integrase family protein, partial [Alphaproteobacteria bacterium]|nr:integrase family protein [Alphaproteobacteria bacterium]
MSTESQQRRTFGFTDRALKGLPVPPKPQQLDYFDSGKKGLGLRISYGGRRTFFLLYSDDRKKRQRLSLGEYGRLELGKLSLAEARKQADIRLGEVAKAHDPAAEARAQRTAPTVTTLAVDFIAYQRRQGKKSADAQERMLAINVIPEIGNVKARAVSRGDVRRIMDAMTERGAPIQANRTHEVVRAMFAFAIDEEVYGIEHNPAATLGKRRNPERGRERWLSLEELGRYWDALEDGPAAAADALRLCLLTGQRNGNVRAMRRDQLVL